MHRNTGRHTHTAQVPHYHSVQVSLMTPRRRQKPTKKQKRLLMRDFTVQTWVGVEASHLNDNEEIHAKEENMNGCRLCWGASPTESHRNAPFFPPPSHLLIALHQLTLMSGRTLRPYTTRRKEINRCSTRRFVKVVVTVRLIQVSGSVDSICWSYFIFTELVLIVLFYSKYWILFLNIIIFI